MILRADDELMRGDAGRRPSMAPAAKRRKLSLIHIAVAKRPRHVLKSGEIGVIAIGLAREESVQGVMEIVRPVCVQAEATMGYRSNQAWVIHVALGDEQ